MGVLWICGVTLFVLPPGDLLEQSSRRRRTPTPAVNVDIEHFSWGHLCLKTSINKLCSSARTCWLLFLLSKAGDALPLFFCLCSCNSSPISSFAASFLSDSLWPGPLLPCTVLEKTTRPGKLKCPWMKEGKNCSPEEQEAVRGRTYRRPSIPSPSPSHPCPHPHSISNSSMFYPIPILIPPHTPSPSPTPSPCHPHVPQCLVLPTPPIGLEDIQSKFICNE